MIVVDVIIVIVIVIAEMEMLIQLVLKLGWKFDRRNDSNETANVGGKKRIAMDQT